VTFLTTGAVGGALAVPGAARRLWIAAIALLSSVLPISTFLLGMARVGAATASIVSTVEPLLTVSLAVLLLGEALAVAPLLDATLVLAVVAALGSSRSTRTRRAQPRVRPYGLLVRPACDVEGAGSPTTVVG
jgi:drug/metabolite transporter (DMT)-like permease